MPSEEPKTPDQPVDSVAGTRITYHIDAERTRAPRIHDLGEDEKPREKLLAHGAKALSNAELLALFLRTGLPGSNAIDLGRQLLAAHGNLNDLARTSLQSYQEIPGIGPAKAAELAAVFEMAARVARERIHRATLDTPEAVYDLVGPSMASLDREVIRVVLVNSRHRHLRSEDVSVGAISECIAHPAMILKPAIAHSAFGFFLVHNHPSGDPTPSSADRKMTRRIRDVAEGLQIRFIDHVIVGSPAEADVDEPYFSFREMGLL
jgi:DNA repair protein RadC